MFLFIFLYLVESVTELTDTLILCTATQTLQVVFIHPHKIKRLALTSCPHWVPLFLSSPRSSPTFPHFDEQFSVFSGTSCPSSCLGLWTLSIPVRFLLDKLEDPGLLPPLAPLSTSTSFLPSLPGRATTHALWQLDGLCKKGWCARDRMPMPSKHCFRLTNPDQRFFFFASTCLNSEIPSQPI